MRQDQQSSRETEIASNYEHLIQLYEQATNVARGLPELFAAGFETEDGLSQLRAVFDRVAVIEAQVLPIKQAWQAAQQHPSQALAGVLSRAEKSIRVLLDVIAEAEQAAQRAKQSLQPELASESRKSRMVNAYRSASDH